MSTPTIGPRPKGGDSLTDRTRMAIRTTIARHYAWRCIIIALVCLVFGVWGVYDYVEKIPSRIQAHERGDAAALVRDAVEPGAEAAVHVEAEERLREARERYIEQYNAPALADVAPPATDEEAIALGQAVREIIGSLRPHNQEPWAQALVTFEHALAAGRVRNDESLQGAPYFAYEVAVRAVEGAAAIPRPRVYDRPVQWMFILCLPFVPYFLWEFYRQRSRVYQLDDDGTLHTPGGSFKPDDVRAIDMSKWMKKSVAHVELDSGKRIKLDDYKQKDLHLIVGAIAHRLYPEDWDEQAKPLKQDRAGEGSEASKAAAE